MIDQLKGCLVLDASSDQGWMRIGFAPFSQDRNWVCWFAFWGGYILPQWPGTKSAWYVGSCVVGNKAVSLLVRLSEIQPARRFSGKGWLKDSYISLVWWQTSRSFREEMTPMRKDALGDSPVKSRPQSSVSNVQLSGYFFSKGPCCLPRIRQPRGWCVEWQGNEVPWWKKFFASTTGSATRASTSLSVNFQSCCTTFFMSRTLPARRVILLENVLGLLSRKKETRQLLAYIVQACCYDQQQRG